MRRMVLVLCLCTAAVGFSSSSALWADPQVGGADPVFLASLAEESPSAGKPSSGGGGEKALCSASAVCGSGAPVGCSSNSPSTSCSSVDRNCDLGQRGHVTCGGVTTFCAEPCPGCNASASCGSGASPISCSTTQAGAQCGSTDRNCAAGQRGQVTCNGQVTQCSQPCPACSIQAFCAGGSTVSCGGSSCSGSDTNCGIGEQGHVTCDGSTQWCPSSCCGIDCFWGEMACSQQCNGMYNYFCNNTSGCFENCQCTGCGSRFCEIQPF